MTAVEKPLTTDTSKAPYRHALPARLPGDLKSSAFWPIRLPISRPLELFLMVATIALPLLAWILATRSGDHQLFLPSPEATAQSAAALWSDGKLIADIGASALRVAAAFLLAAVLGVPLGLLAGSFRSMEAMIIPITGAIRYMPVAAFIPLVIIWVGIGEASKVLIIFLGVFFVNVLMVADAVKFVPMEMVNAAYTLGASRLQVLRRVILPAVLPSMLDTLRINVSGAWNYLVVAELLASSEGLGFRIMRAQRFLQTSDIFVCILIIGAIGILLDLSFKLLSRRLVPWAHQSH